MKAKAALAVKGAFPRCMSHGGGRKVGIDGRGTVDNRQQWQWQSGNNQLKVMVASSGVNSRRSGGEQWRSTAIGSKMPMAKAIVDMSSTPLLLPSAGSGKRAAANGSQGGKESGHNVSSHCRESAPTLSPHPSQQSLSLLLSWLRQGRSLSRCGGCCTPTSLGISGRHSQEF